MEDTIKINNQEYYEYCGEWFKVRTPQVVSNFEWVYKDGHPIMGYPLGLTEEQQNSMYHEFLKNIQENEMVYEWEESPTMDVEQMELINSHPITQRIREFLINFHGTSAISLLADDSSINGLLAVFNALLEHYGHAILTDDEEDLYNSTLYKECVELALTLARK